jgi:hypothetical protein
VLFVKRSDIQCDLVNCRSTVLLFGTLAASVFLLAPSTRITVAVGLIILLFSTSFITIMGEQCPKGDAPADLVANHAAATSDVNQLSCRCGTFMVHPERYP